MEEFSTYQTLICAILVFGAAALGVYQGHKNEKERNRVKNTYVKSPEYSIESIISNDLPKPRMSLEKKISN